MPAEPKRVVVEGVDGRWGWELVAANGQIIATDGDQGYEKESDARAMADRITSGEFKAAKKVRRPLKKV